MLHRYLIPVTISSGDRETCVGGMLFHFVFVIVTTELRHVALELDYLKTLSPQSRATLYCFSLPGGLHAAHLSSRNGHGVYRGPGL